MKQHHRVAMGAGFGLLAIAGIASSGAFACTREVRIASADGGQITVAPGQFATVTSTSFSKPMADGYSAIAFEWLAYDGTVLATLGTITAPTGAPTGSPGGSFTTDGTTNTTTFKFAVPASATTQPYKQHYWVRASQAAPSRPVPFAHALPVFIPDGYHAGGTGAAGGPADDGTVGATDGASLKGNVLTDGPAGPSGADGLASREVVAAPERRLAPPVSESGPAAPQVADVPTAPGVPSAGPVSDIDPAQPLPADPSEAQLWSGIKTSASPSSLLDGPRSAPSSSGTPAGGILLLGMGVAALAGTGAVVGRRRLVLAKAARR